MKPKLAAILVAGFVLRTAYVLLQPRFDPTFARPILDGAYYVAAAHTLAAGGAAGGVYYMPPLYPWVLSVFIRLFGDAWTLLFLVQQFAVVASAGLLALVSRRFAGETAGLATAALVLLYHPSLFFASRPLGESLALLLMAGALAIDGRGDDRSSAGAGFVWGLASLLRPNFLPVAPVWTVLAFARKNLRRGFLLCAALLVGILPALWHNYAATKHLVPVSANGGVVFWLGNAPGALGVYTSVTGFTGSLQTQQAEAIAEASARAGRALDAVETDGYWWREGIRARTAEPAGTIELLVRRAILLVDSSEHGLDYAPALDANPLRFAAPIPFAVILALAVFGCVACGWGRTGGFAVWSCVLVSAAAPMVFYVSSRHRLPMAFLLAVPAGAGFAALLGPRRPWPLAAGVCTLAVSFGIPSAALMRAEKASALSVVSDVQRKSGELDAAADTARRATALDAGNAVAWFNRGVIEAARGHQADAERAYRASLDADPEMADAAANLAGILVATGRASEAAPALEKALAAWPRNAVGWTNLVVAYAASGDMARARDAARRAVASGVSLDPELVKTVEAADRR